MDRYLSSELSIGLIPICLLLAVVITGALYFKNKKNNDWVGLKLYVLISLRFISSFILSLLLLNFFITSKETQKKKPIIVVAQDNSKSIAMIQDSAEYLQQYIQQLTTLKSKLSSTYEVLSYDFGSKAQKGHGFLFNDEETDFSQLFGLFSTALYNQNVKALIVASDGINNKGTDPVLAAQKLNFPLYFCALGDTIKPKDAFIDDVYFNKTVFKGNTFPLIINVMANNSIGDSLWLKVYNKGMLEAQQKVVINKNDFFKKVYFQLEAKEEGVQSYGIELDSVNNESNILNNNRKINIRVRDDKQKILFVQNGYNPDAAAFKQVFKNQQSYELVVINIEGFNQPLDDYSLVILNQLPSVKHNLVKLYQQISEAKIPLLFIVGEHTQIKGLNNLQLGFEIKQNKKLFDDVKASLNPNFSLFNISINEETMNAFTPLKVPFADYVFSSLNNVLIYQKLGNIITEKPLVYFASNTDFKVGVIFGEGIWRWRLQDFRLNRNHDFTNELITKMVHYLAINEQKERLKIEFKGEYEDSKTIRIDAKLYNAAYKLVNSPELEFILKNEKGKEFNYTFNKTELSYALDLGKLSEGDYQFKASTILGDEEFIKSGSFAVLKSQKEHLNLKANHNLLYKLARNSGGQVFYPEELDKLAINIEQNVSSESTIIEHDSFSEVLNLKWLFALITILILLEWFLRKFWGGV